MGFRQQTATTTAAQFVPFQKDRVSLLVENISANPAFIHRDISNVTGQGWRISAGGFISFQKLYGDEPENALYCQTTALTADLRIVDSYGKVGL